MGILGWTQVGIIMLKIAAVISWSWWIVFIPLYLIVLIQLVVILFAAVAAWYAFT
jgi:hypothetical protein